uniref:Transposase n=1 Tax=Meloidogyne hapla TaxID=6305 RepID=A0A1I8BTD1_MELHA
MPLTCPTNNSAREKFWIPFFDHKSLDIEKKKRSMLTVRSGSEFFSFENNKNRLSLYQILKLLEYYLMSTPLSLSVQKLELNRKTVYDWRSLFRDPPFVLFDRADPMGGLGEICQIDEILLR